MKRTIKTAVSVILCICILSGACVAGFAASSVSPESQSGIVSYSSIGEYIARAEAAGKSVTVANAAAVQPAAEKSITGTSLFGTTLGNILVKIVNFISDFFINTVALGALRAVVPTTSKVVNKENFNLDTYGNFYKGNETFIDKAAEGAHWSLGYSEKSILPADFGTKPYRRGSMAPYASTTETFDDLRVRTVILDDGSSRGKVVFSVIDCIGLANADVRKIRAAVADFAAANNIVSINVSATHTHSGIDTQGVWNDPIGTLANNLLSATGLVDVKSSVDTTFMQTLIDQTAASIKEACGSMAAGSLNYAVKDISNYAHDRTPPSAYDPHLYRLEFVPFEKSLKPTMIVSFGCHPETTSYSFATVSGDFVYYMEQVMNKAGYNFVFIQGNVSTATSSRDGSDDGLQLDDHECAVRYGYEMAYVTLGLTLTAEQCAALNTRTGDMLGVKELGGNPGYTVWYKNWVPVTKTEVPPVLNIRMQQFLLKADSNLVSAMGKVSMAANLIIYDKSTGAYYSVTEIGYMEIGNVLKVFLSPGEIMSEILVGGPGLWGFQYESLRETYGDNLIIFDLMNDAIGYVAADPNYVMVGNQYDAGSDSYVSDSWCFLISFGKYTGSTLIKEFHNLVDSVR